MDIICFEHGNFEDLKLLGDVVREIHVSRPHVPQVDPPSLTMLLQLPDAVHAIRTKPP